jgi:hypothetical protein
MSDRSEGPGWWIASDGKWYPPELHPSVRDTPHTETPAQVPGESQTHRWQGPAQESGRVGPQFPDLFKKALEGSHLADNVSVKYDLDDVRSASAPAPTRSMVGARAGSGTQRTASAGTTFGPPPKRKWRKGR